jgi:hypothetical protein
MDLSHASHNASHPRQPSIGLLLATFKRRFDSSRVCLWIVLDRDMRLVAVDSPAAPLGL